MSLLELDKKGRVTVPKECRRELGFQDKVLVINTGDHLKLIPIPKDPIKALRGAFTVRKSFKELRKQAEAEAERGETAKVTEMPLIENDVTFAFLNSLEPKFKLADRIFNKIRSSVLKVSLSGAGRDGIGLSKRGKRGRAPNGHGGAGVKSERSGRTAHPGCSALRSVPQADVWPRILSLALCGYGSQA
jgi:AbrB family looped-hinge helix DNA binding protein